MMKSLFQWLKTNLDLTSDAVSLLIAIVLIVKYQTQKPQPNNAELLVGILAVLSVIAISGIIEKRSRLSRMEKLIQQEKTLLENKVIDRIKADEFFQKDHKPSQEFFNSADTICISGITLGNTSGQFSYILSQRLKAGANIRVILLSSEKCVLEQIVLRSWGETSSEYYEKRLENTFELIKIMSTTPDAKGSLEIGFLPYVPSFGITMIDPDTPQGKSYIEIYHHNSTEPGPSFYLNTNKDPFWFRFFKDQFELMWNQSSQKTVLEYGSNKYRI